MSRKASRKKSRSICCLPILPSSSAIRARARARSESEAGVAGAASGLSAPVTQMSLVMIIGARAISENRETLERLFQSGETSPSCDRPYSIIRLGRSRAPSVLTRSRA